MLTYTVKVFGYLKRCSCDTGQPALLMSHWMHNKIVAYSPIAITTFTLSMLSSFAVYQYSVCLCWLTLAGNAADSDGMRGFLISPIASSHP